MKTSTKLLLIFFLCIPVSLWAYNTLLKKQLNARNIVMELRPDPDQQYDDIKLPAFKYVVVNGALTFRDGKAQDTVWRPKISIGDNGKPNITNGISILKQFADIVKYRIAHDTLYVSFNNSAKYEIGEYPMYQPYVVKITPANISELNGTYARFNYNTDAGAKTLKDLKINIAERSSLNMWAQQLNKLDLTIKNTSEAEITGSAVNELYYSMLNNAKLTIDINLAKHFHAGTLDSTANINLQGRASNVKQLLKP